MIVVGNWKMFTDKEDGPVLAAELVHLVDDLALDIDLVICPPFTGLHAVSEGLNGSGITLGGQNMHWSTDGAYTGEVSPRMLLTSGCRYVILGHSERRTYFGETNEIVNRKVRSALTAGLTPIMCIGETLAEREAGETEAVVATQVEEGVQGLDGDGVEKMVLAYEPIWAIGTGQVATPAQANAVHHHIRHVLTGLFGRDTASIMRIQYGGSVKPDNAAALFSESDIDGALVGGASLDASSFVAIARAALGWP
jgi:triosephosphate isomerase